MKLPIKLLVVVSVAVCVNACSNSTDVAGATLETTNGSASSVVVSSSGEPVNGADVYLNDINSLLAPNQIRRKPEVQSDHLGSFTVILKDPGTYLFEINDRMGNSAQIVSEFTGDEKITLPKVVPLAKTGRLFGKVQGLATKNLYVQLYGLQRTVPVENELFFIDSLPAGTISMQIITDDDSVVVEKMSINIEPSKSTDVGLFRLESQIEEEKSIVEDLLAQNGVTSYDLAEIIQVKKGHIFNLNLDNMGLQFITPEIGLLRLEQFSIAQNNITTLPEAIGDITQMEYIDLSGNKLTELPAVIGRLTSLKYIDLGSNDLTTLPDYIVDLQNIEWLYVNNNKLTALPHHIKYWVDTYSADNGWLSTQRQ